MTRLPLLSGQELVKIVSQFGYHAIRQRGSHIRLACADRKSITIPNHKIIGHGLLNKILRDADITPEIFIKLYNGKR